MCGSCSTYMWWDERSDKQRTTSKLNFSLCCMKGKLSLPKSRDPPSILSNFIFNQDPTSKHFQEQIRSYNMMFSFTSLGGKIETSINNGAAPYTFLLHGQNYHLLGSLLPEDGSSPKFAQLYILTERTKLIIVCVRSGIFNLFIFVFLIMLIHKLTHY